MWTIYINIYLVYLITYMIGTEIIKLLMENRLIATDYMENHKVYVYVCMCMYMYICMWTENMDIAYIYTYMYTHVYTPMRACVYLCAYVYEYMYVYVYVCIHLFVIGREYALNVIEECHQFWKRKY